MNVAEHVETALILSIVLILSSVYPTSAPPIAMEMSADLMAVADIAEIALAGSYVI